MLDNFQRVKQQNFYTQDFFDSNGNRYTILKSYWTIVGMVDYTNNRVFEVKYSPTTSKQVSKFCGYGNQRIVVTAEQLKTEIETVLPIEVNTRYNSCHICEKRGA